MALRAAAVQFRTSADRQSTLAKAGDLIRRAAQDHSAQLVVLPEAFTGLYGVAHFKANAEDWKGRDSGTQLMSRCASEHGIHVVGGVIEQHPISKKMFNTIAAFGPDGRECARYRKLHLSRVSVGQDNTSEGSLLEAGEDLSWFDIMDNSVGSDGRGWRIGMANCFDLRFRELSDMLTSYPPHGLGAELLLYPSSWLKSTGDMGHWETLLKARALDCQCFTMGVSNARDESHQTVAFGRSCIIGPMGETLAVCEDDTADEIVVATLRLDHLLDTRRRIPLSTARRPVVYERAIRAMQENPLAMCRPSPRQVDDV